MFAYMFEHRQTVAPMTTVVAELRDRVGQCGTDSS
jgi:hypothetical protein